MPAIQLARLKLHVAGLVANFDQPVSFRKALRDLFEFYADRTYRPGRAGLLPPLLPNYHIHRQVTRQIETELFPLIMSDPQAALRLADELWTDAYLEPRLLAVYIFSQVTTDPPEPILERLIKWTKPEEDRQVLTAFLSQGTVRLQREQPELWARLIKDWLTSEDPVLQSYGLRAILAMINDAGFENLPAVFRLISPLMQSIPDKLQGDMVTILEATAKRWPAETAFFLRQLVSISQGPGVPRIIRRCLPLLTPDQQTSLRSALQMVAAREINAT